MKLTVHTDGGSLNNPGQAAIGFLIHDGDTLVYNHSEAIGIATNNVAEYTALIRALEYVRDNLLDCHSGLDPESSPNMDPRLGEDDIESIHIIADSELMIRQVTGLYKVKNPDIRMLHSQVKILEMELGIPVTYRHVLRHLNSDADALVKKALGR